MQISVNTLSDALDDFRRTALPPGIKTYRIAIYPRRINGPRFRVRPTTTPPERLWVEYVVLEKVAGEWVINIKDPDNAIR